MNNNRICEAYNFLRKANIVMNQTDMAKQMDVSVWSVSRALNKENTDLRHNSNFIRSFIKTFGSIINKDWIMRGIGSMVSCSPIEAGQIYAEANKEYANKNNENEDYLFPTEISLKNSSHSIKIENELLKKENEYLKAQVSSLTEQLKKEEKNAEFFKNMLSNSVGRY